MKKTILLSLAAMLCCFLLSSARAGNMLSLFMMIKRGDLPKVSLSAEPAAIKQGEAATLSWTSRKAKTVSIDNGIGEVAASGTKSVSPTVTTTYTITAAGAKGTATDSVTVTVPPPPTVSLSADPASIVE